MLNSTLDINGEYVSTEAFHIPVMIDEVAAHLRLPPGGIFVDGTLGLGGHAAVLAEKIGRGGRLIGIDRDRDSLEIARERLQSALPACTFVHDDFRHLDKILRDLEVEPVDGILLDLGISSFQLDNAQRGFSLKEDGPLDMRMNRDSYLSAFDLINSLSEKEIALILKNYGQERWHTRIARLLVARRATRPLETTADLKDVVLRAIPPRQTWQKIHPATRTFQAFRIVVNRELESLEIVMDRFLPCLKSGGRICVIAFHSLEDRIVKNQFRALARAGEIKLVTKKPLRPSVQEQDRNPRARSARLRAAEKI